MFNIIQTSNALLGGLAGLGLESLLPGRPVPGGSDGSAVAVTPLLPWPWPIPRPPWPLPRPPVPRLPWPLPRPPIPKPPIPPQKSSGMNAVALLPIFGPLVLPSGVLGHLVCNLAESFVDNVIRTTVTPVPGSVVYCDLAFGCTGHSGIYVGPNRIVHLDGDGRIEAVSPRDFMARNDGFNPAISIYVSCRGEKPVGSKETAKRARAKIGKAREYDLLFSNCHHFTAGCLTGDFENTDCTLTLIKMSAQEHLDADTWRVWDLPV